MLILPQGHDYKLLMPQRRVDWLPPSANVPKLAPEIDEQRTWWRLIGYTHDGVPKVQCWFADREDADAFSWALVRAQACGDTFPRHLLKLASVEHLPLQYDLPLPWAWDGPWLDLVYELATVSFLTTTSGSNQTWDVLVDWNSADNSVDVIASGGSGGARRGANSTNQPYAAGGGGGGGWSRQTNITLTPSGTAEYRLEAGGAGRSTFNQNQSLQGNDGGDAWFNGATLGTSSVGAKGGGGGQAGGVSGVSGGAGGAAADGVGSTKTSGGGGGSAGGGTARAGGGGGAGGATSNGAYGGSSSGAGAGAGNGGDGGSPSGGAGSNGGDFNSGTGGAGTAYQASPARGSGGGSGGSHRAGSTTSRSTGNGGNFGAGSGGAVTQNPSGNTGNANSGAGGPALIVITYTPAGGVLTRGGKLARGILIRGGRLS